MLSPLTYLLGECGHTKAPRATKTKRKPWHWNKVHQTAFNNINTTIAKDDVLAYPHYSYESEIYTDSSKFKLQAVIIQNSRPLELLSRKQNTAQQKYSMTELKYWP